MDDRDNFIVNEEEQNIPVNPQEKDYSSEGSQTPAEKEITKPDTKKLKGNIQEDESTKAIDGNMDESEGFDPNMVPPV